MNRKKIIGILSIGALAVAAAFGAVAYRSASAATPASAASASDFVAQMGKGFGGDFHGGYSDEDLASALGITVDELTAARQTANEAALAQAVEQGLITQAQADELKTDGSAFPFGGRWSGWMNQNGIDFDVILADALGISVEKLQAAYATAFNAHIDQAVADGSLTQEQADLMKGRYALANDQGFQDSMQSAYEAAIEEAVTNGVITQAQADLILQNQSGMGFHGFGDFDGMRGPGGPGGPGGHGHHGEWSDSDDQTTVPTTTP